MLDCGMHMGYNDDVRDPQCNTIVMSLFLFIHLFMLAQNA